MKKKYDEVFASRPFIFEKSFDVKKEPHLGTCVRFDDDYVNNLFNLSCEDDEHENFASSLTTTKRNKIVADLCEDDKALVVKGMMISPVTWRHLIGAGTKEKGKEMMSEPTLKSEVAKSIPAPTPAKSLPEEPMLANLWKYLSSINRNHEEIFKKIQRIEHKSSNFGIISMRKTRPFGRPLQG
ncbi:hypothetical protein V6N11_018731 [Hibiscus sabdariffa]|uniref:Uncharacterized protein n=1 Tax=Hibiscus sabdariffa TaxID=183260 RepID=A0ABR2QT67_9ROSI